MNICLTRKYVLQPNMSMMSDYDVYDAYDVTADSKCRISVEKSRLFIHEKMVVANIHEKKVVNGQHNLWKWTTENTTHSTSMPFFGSQTLV